ncbi:MAG: MerR family transcriptional regulator [Geodermatophilaceae bacterium]|nr:MerR family transcriptional regulator [Geodermatophilaceae bacterium]MDQ3456750.1 MerR family transcriptional regulator [Actinomycetota bacterium]
MTASARSFMSIGEVLAQLRPEFPEITISKIRFLEEQGLISPERTPAGYRKFARDDVTRLRYVLAAQRDQYLPLKVIKENLGALDRGLTPSAGPGEPAGLPRGLSLAAGLPGPEDFLREPADIRLSRTELLTASGLADEQLAQLEQFGLVASSRGYYDADGLVVAKTVRDMGGFGIEARHLRGFRSAADREIGLFEQVITPIARQRGPEARGRAEEVVRELASLSVRLHASLVKAGLRRVLGG